MLHQHKTKILALLGIADLTCFVLGGLNYGEIWSMAGVFGLLAFFVLVEVL